MQYISHYNSPLGDMLLAADDEGLTGLWFEGQKYYALHLDRDHKEYESEFINRAKRWLDIYFSGKEPDFSVLLNPVGTDFQKAVWDILCRIPYGNTVTYGEIARSLAQKRGVEHISPQAVGGAVGHNPISIIVPCHRVVGASGSLTGYASGIDRKWKLLLLERADIKGMTAPLN